jgi:hypothetical protein
MGPVEAVTADAGAGDVTHLILHHRGGASSTVTVTVGAPEAADGSEGFLWGEAGWSRMPGETGQPVAALRLALTELAANIRSGRTDHDCDVRFGRDVNRVLADAQRQLDQRQLDQRQLDQRQLDQRQLDQNEAG